MQPQDHAVLAAEMAGRPVVQVRGRHSMVSSMAPEATLAAVGVLRDGGNAVDAAIAAAAVLAVVSPTWSGLAGDSAWLVRCAGTGEFLHLDGYSRCPASLTATLLAQRFGLAGGAAIREEPPATRHMGVVTSLVPGTPAALALAARRFATRPMAELLAPAIELAEEGFPVNAYLARMLVDCAGKMAPFRTSRRIFFHDDRPLGEGETLRQPDLAGTLRRFALDPEGEFVRGDTSRRIVAHMAGNGGILRGADLADYRAVWRGCPEIAYRGRRVVSTGLPTAGVHLLQVLGLLDRVDLAALGYHSAASLHRLIQSCKLALADRRRWGGDPDQGAALPGDLLDPARLDRLAASIDPRRCTPAAPAEPRIAQSTTFFVVADRRGNIVAATQSIGENAGCGEVAEGTGLLMNDRSWWMSLDGGPNAVTPGRRAGIGHAPAILLRDGRPELALGSPGGFGIVPYVVQVLTNVVDHGMDAQSAIEAPRFRLDDLDRAVFMEGRIVEATRAELGRMGHAITTAGPWVDRVGAVEAVQFDAATGQPLGGSDPRRNSMAAGL